MNQPAKVRVAVVGATGYTGAELLRLMHGHPGIEVTTIAGHGKAGQKVANVLPNLHGTVTGEVASVDVAAIAATADAAFCGLPHGASSAIVRQLRERGLVVFDLSADFRLQDLSVYREWYGEHDAPELLAGAVYGLCELEREAIRTADLVAVPGCYPTASALAIAPLVKAGLVELDTLIVDAKSGASGAGRGLSESTHFAQLSEGLRAYKVAGLHRHTPEIEQTLGRLAGREVRITFTPHLVPMIRGILATVYARVPADLTVQRCTELARALYEGSPSVTVLDPGTDPDTQWVRGSNRAFVSYAIDKRTRRVVAQAAIDNLVKGASGQALQCFNLRFGFAEGTGISGLGLFPVMRILHFSDVHVQEAMSALPTRELLNKRLFAAGNLFLVRGKLFREVLHKLEALGNLARDAQVDLGLCTGDYTAVGGEAELISARRAIAPFTSLPRGLVTVPGNHDVYLPDTLRDKRFERHFGDLLHSDLPELATDGPFPFVRLFGDDLAIIGINSAKPNPSPFVSSGRVSAAQRKGLTAALEHPSVRERFVIVMTHYGILRANGRPDSHHHGLEEAESLMPLCNRPRLMFVHGHIHHRYYHRPAAGRPWLFCAGSAIQRGREGAWLYEVEQGAVRAIPVSFTGSAYKLEPEHAVTVG